MNGTRAAPSITYPTAAGLNYGAKLSTSALTGGSTTYGSFAWEDGSIVPTVTNSGCSVKFTPSEATLKNYEAITSLVQTVSISVAKTPPAIALKAQVSGDTGSRRATLTAALTKVGDGEIPAGTVKFVNSTSGADVDITGATAVSITDGVATYTWTELADQAYKVKAEYSGSDNYQIATATEISFDTRKQNQQNFAIAAIGTKTYGDGAFTLTTSGNVTITANKAADDSYNEASATARLTVNKKAISFIANDMPNVVKGSQMPAFTYKPVTLATGDSMITEPTLTTTVADTNTLGKFLITISDAVVKNADSYTITYVNGEMTVVEQLHTVTMTDGTGGGQYSEGQTVSITANNVGTHWAKNDIDFVIARGLLSGISNATFAPETSMTRGMFVTALGRLAGVDTKKYENAKFTDVKTDAYYAPYVAWANANNIVNGTNDTTFSPDKAISRQEMAVMLVNYSKTIGYKLPSVHAEVTFTDASSIASWAKDAVGQMQMAGILMGKSGNRFDPTAAATRAEVSAMLRHYVELVVNTETAEGWAMNESGQWMYIQDGNRVTGKKTIDGTAYTFDQFGVTTALPPERKYLTYPA